MAAQFDVYENPLHSQRTVYPFVVVLQSPFAGLADSRIIAPATMASNPSAIAGILTPVFEHNGRKYILHIPSLTAIRLDMLRVKVGNIAGYRVTITTALDRLFHDNA